MRLLGILKSFESEPSGFLHRRHHLLEEVRIVVLQSFLPPQRYPEGTVLEVANLFAELALVLPVVVHDAPACLEALPVDEVVAAEHQEGIFLLKVLRVILIAADDALVVAGLEAVLFFDGLAVVEVGSVHLL